MIHLRSTYSAWSLELALLPWFTPAQLPEANIDVLPSAEEGFSINGEPLDIRSAEGRLTLPEPQLSNVQIASRIQYVHSFFDIFLSYNHCFDSLPQANGELLLTGFQTDQDRVDVGIPLIYPRLDIIGLGSTFRLPKDSIGWLEISYTMPQETSLIASQEQLDSLQILGVISDVPFPLPHTTTQDGAPYTKWILGVEHFFGPVLLNAQWLHGFVTERQQQDLNDYALLSSRWTIQPTIRLDSGAAFDGKGALLFTDLFFLIQDEIELGIGGFYTPTKEGSTFASYTELQHARLQANMKF